MAELSIKKCPILRKTYRHLGRRALTEKVVVLGRLLDGYVRMESHL